MSKLRLAVVLSIAGLAAAFFAFGGHRYLSVDQLKAQHSALQSYALAHPWEAGGAFFALYVAVTGLSLPGAAVMTLAAGAIFGLAWGVVIVSFASTIGATLAFLASRFLLRDWVQARFGDRLKPVNEGIAKDGAFYLFALRLV
ncbi:MAG: TVP38/TMEM64 family protein, partial [Betaproteobacteria bacterium]|nr:TVP38/TMEM64 family protein [Betaproteobacteria bacterium]